MKSSFVIYTDIYRILKDYPDKDIIIVYFSLELSANTLLAKLKSTVGLEQIELTTEIDENLIGGYILHWDDKMIDNSISRGLAILKDEFDNNDYVRKF